ncbi:cytochrome P450 [Phytoactinopolyspora halotolerans]|uniref:Cytochrome P450 n=1 Tax=Phytoactinopolyspora halotolerans TaxID=1981512 RepID=A0A6L9SJC7_9ACTN|nr:cytochrome P450 [Phytoactinopolyspora halotolerans]
MLDSRTLDRRAARELPPGPRWPMAAQTAAFAVRRAQWLPALRARYGDVFCLRLIPRGRVVVVLSRPDDIRAVFSAPTDVVHTGEGNTIMAAVMGENSLMVLDEDDHLRLRKQLMPAFHGRALRGYQGMVARIADAVAAAMPTEQPVRMHERMRALTLEVILQVVFGVTDSDRLARLRPLVGAVVEVNPVIMLAAFYPRLMGYPPWRRYRRIQREVDTILFDEIAARRRTDLESRTDVLSQLLRTGTWSDAELRDQLVTLLLAGHETTATALAWAFHELARNPVVLRRAQAAADDSDDEAGEAYLEAVAKESLRLRPVIYQVGRRLTAPYEVADYRLPRGTTVMPAIGLVHADPTLYPDPHVFRPERFLGDDTVPSANWIPFGGGTRRCLGAGFSLMEATEILRAVLRRYDVRPQQNEPERQRLRNVTLVPAHGCHVILSVRT